MRLQVAAYFEPAADFAAEDDIEYRQVRRIAVKAGYRLLPAVILRHAVAVRSQRFRIVPALLNVIFDDRNCVSHKPNLAENRRFVEL